MRGGAFDYLTKPVALSELKERAPIACTRAPRGPIPGGRGSKPASAAILGNSPLIIELRQRIARLLEAEAPVRRLIARGPGRWRDGHG